MSYNAEEWLSENMHRNFPLDDGVYVADTEGRPLPSDFLCSVHITMPPTKETDSDSRVFLQSVEPYMSGVRLVFAYDTGTGTFPFMRTLEIPRDAELFSEHTLLAFNTFELPAGRDELAYCTGSVIIGQMGNMMASGRMEFTPTTGKVTSQCVSLALMVQKVKDPASPSYITITDSNGIVHTIDGDLDIWPGDGIVISVETEEDGSGHTIGRMVISSATDYKDGLSGMSQPVTSINGVLPDVNGDITIFGDHCTSIEQVPGGLRISNPCATPCCTSSDLDDVREGLLGMEAAKNHLSTYFGQLDERINDLQARLNALLAK